MNLLAKFKFLKDKAKRVAKKEAVALIRTFFPIKANGEWAAKNLGFSSNEELIAYFKQKKEIPLFGFACGEYADAVDVFQHTFFKQKEYIISQADAFLREEVNLHGFCYSKNGMMQWHTDPISKQVIPIKYARYYRFNTFNPFPDGSIDPIILFKLHTHQHLCRLGQAYFLTKNPRYAEALTDQLLNWIETFPVGHGYPYLITLNVAQRLISWCVIFTFIKNSSIFQKQLLAKFLHAIHLQANYIYQHLSTVGLTNNFLLAECVALYLVASLFPELPSSEEWKITAINQLKHELPKQVLPDGISFEQSMGYQRFVAELLILISLLDSLTETANRVNVEANLRNMLLSMLYLSGPAGDIPQFGDVSLERALWLSCEESLLQVNNLLSLGAVILNDPQLAWKSKNDVELLFWVKGKGGLNIFNEIERKSPDHLSKLFSEGGFAVLHQQQTKHSLQVAVDCGAIGLSGAGGHGHNDVLNFVVWSGAIPVFIDPGTYTYFSSRKWRDKFRATASHNIVQIDNEELTMLGPGLFQLGKCASPNIENWYDGFHKETCLIASHSRQHDILYRRKMLLSERDEFFVNDTLTGSGRHVLVWRFHCHPDVQVELTSPNIIKLKLINGHVLNFTYSNAENIKCELLEGWYSPSYGKKESTTVIALSMEAALPVNQHFSLVHEI